jgi:hypothetical protein
VSNGRQLADSRRVVYFTDGGSSLVVFDTVTGKRTPIEIPLPGPSAQEMFAVSPDNKTIYYGAMRSEADIWIVERPWRRLQTLPVGAHHL